jgi:hypothetical protein
MFQTKIATIKYFRLFLSIQLDRQSTCQTLKLKAAALLHNQL